MKKQKCELCGECECTCRKNIIKVYFCPKCKSPRVSHPFKFKNLFGLIPKWKCADCGFESTLFPIAYINKNKIKNGKRRRK